MASSSSVPYDVMKAAVAEDFGKPASSKVVVTTLPKAVIGDPDDVLIKVKAVSLNPIDYKIIHGDLNSLLTIEKPIRLGYDVSGVVEKVGAGVTTFKQGDEVYSRVAHHRVGTLASYVVTPQSTVALKPKSLSHVEAAAVPLAGLTALQAIRDVGGAKTGDSILILGGGGGVGTFAIQIAKNIIGASQVITTVGTNSISQAAQLGATQTIDYKKEKFSSIVQNVDVVLDTTGEANSAFSVVRSGGRVVSLVAAPTPEALKKAGIEVSAVTSAFLTAAAAPTLANAALRSAQYTFLWMKPSGAELTEFAQWIDAGKIKPVIDSTYTLDQIKQAFDHLETGHPKGKIVVTID